MSDLVNLDRVRSLLRSITARRRFLAYRAQQQAKRMENQGRRSSFSISPCTYLSTEIPSIVVDGLPETPPTSTRDISSAGYDSPSPSGTPWQSTPPPHHRSSSAGLDFSLALDTSPGAGLQRSSRRISDISLLSTMDVTLKSCVYFFDVASECRLTFPSALDVTLLQLATGCSQLCKMPCGAVSPFRSSESSST